MVSVRANSQPSTCVQRTHNLPRGSTLLRAPSFSRVRGRPRCRLSHNRTIFDPPPSNESPLDPSVLSAMTLNYNIAFDDGHTVPRTDSNLSRGTNWYTNRLHDAEHGRCSGGMRVGGCWHSINSSTSGRDPAPPGGTSIGLVDRDIAPCIDSPISPTSVRPDRTSDCGPRNSSKSFELGLRISCRLRATHPLRIRRGGTHHRFVCIRRPLPTPPRFVTTSELSS